jgi:hypothetical protein
LCASHEHSKIVHLVLLDRSGLCTLDNLRSQGKTESVVIYLVMATCNLCAWSHAFETYDSHVSCIILMIQHVTILLFVILWHHWELCKLFARPHDVVTYVHGHMHLKRMRQLILMRSSGWLFAESSLEWQFWRLRIGGLSFEEVKESTTKKGTKTTCHYWPPRSYKSTLSHHVSVPFPMKWFPYRF